jgi:hypothetical protein
MLKLSDEEVEALDRCRARHSMTRAEFVRFCLAEQAKHLELPKLARTLGAVDTAIDAVTSLVRDGFRG